MTEDNFNLPEYLQIIDELKEETEKEFEELEIKSKLLSWSRKYVRMTQNELLNLQRENTNLKNEIKQQKGRNIVLSKELDYEIQIRKTLEMNLAETRKLMDSIAKKSSEESVQKAIQTFVNYSKSKTSDKRTYIKNTLLEFIRVSRISLPEDLSAIIDCLDDEQTEPRNVTVNGGVYNDIHDNKEVYK